MVLNYLVSGFLDLLAYCWRLYQGGIEVNNKIPTTLPWWRIAPTAAQVVISMYIAASVAALVVLRYAPEFAEWWVKS